MQPILFRNFKLAEQSRRIFRITLEEDWNIADLEKAKTWLPIEAKVNRYDLIEAVTCDGDSYMEFIVLSKSKSGVKVKLKSRTDLSDEVKPIVSKATTDSFEVSYGGPNGKYRVIRKSDKVKVSEQFERKEDAEKWLQDNEKILMAG